MQSQSNARALEGKCLVVIGGTTGLGISAARSFVAAGARVVVVGRDAARAADAASQLGQAAHALSADAIQPDTAPNAIRKAIEIFGDFHGLYHVAGGSGRRWGDGPLHQLSDAAWLATTELNLTSVIYSNRAAVQQLLAQGKGGAILNLSSVLAFSPSPEFFATHAYATAKAAIIGLTRSCAAYYARQNIRFNALAPSLIATPMSQRAREDQAIHRFIQTKQPLDGGRMGRPEDVDAAAVYFMSDASRFTTGQVLAVDGGWSVTEGGQPP
jgi:NAD(P)-dependent dehydrogenase (short-subunit alcohol dehydrogenase family)